MLSLCIFTIVISLFLIEILSFFYNFFSTNEKKVIGQVTLLDSTFLGLDKFYSPDELLLSNNWNFLYVFANVVFAVCFFVVVVVFAVVVVVVVVIVVVVVAFVV
jgi:hypothetical protein